MVVDDAEHPDRDEAEDPDEREVGAPEQARAAHGDAPRTAPALVLERGDEITAAAEDPADGLAGRQEAEHALAQPLELPRAEGGLLDVEAHELGFEVVGRAVPGAAPTASERGSRPREAVLLEPASIEPPERAVPAEQVARNGAAQVVDDDGEAEQHAQREEAGAIEEGEQDSHSREATASRSRWVDDGRPLARSAADSSRPVPRASPTTPTTRGHAGRT